MELEPVTKEDWMQWKSNPVTRQYLSDLNLERETVKEDLARGSFGVSFDRGIGGCEGLKFAIEYLMNNFEYLGRQQEEKYSGPESQSDRV